MQPVSVLSPDSQALVARAERTWVEAGLLWWEMWENIPRCRELRQPMAVSAAIVVGG